MKSLFKNFSGGFSENKDLVSLQFTIVPETVTAGCGNEY